MPGNTLEVTLAFKPLFEGLNRFTSAITERMSRVQAFNRSIENGAAATNALLAQAAASFSGARLAQAFSSAISGGVKLNAELEQQTQAFATLLGSVSAAELRIKELYDFAANTPFQFPEIVQASKLLQSFSGSALSTGEGLRLVGDAAAAVGKPIADVSMWFGRLYAALRNGMASGEAVARLTELGLMSGKARQQIAALEGTALKSADVMKVLRTAFGSTSGAMDRQAGTLNGLRSTLSDTFGAVTAAATERLTAKIKELTQALIALLQADGVQRIFAAIADSAAVVVVRITALVKAFGSLGPSGQQAIVSTVRGIVLLGAAAGAVIVPLVLIRGAIATIGTLVNPLRAAFVFIAGVNFTTAVSSLGAFVAQWGALTPFALKTPGWLQAVMDKGEAVFRLLTFRLNGATASASAFAASWPRVTAGLATVGQTLGVLALAAAAFWAGWKLGEMLNELEVGGAKVKDWAAAIVGQLMAWGVQAWGVVREAWADIAFAFTEYIPAIKITILEFLVWLGEKFNNGLGEKLGFKIPTDGLKKSLADAQAALEKASNEHTVKVRKIAAETKATAEGFAEAGLDILAQGKADLAKKLPTSAPKPVTPASGGDDDSLIKSKEQRARELDELKAAIEKDRLQNEQAYDQKIIDLDAYLANRQSLLERSIAAEKKLGETQPGKNAIALALAREADEQAKIRREAGEKEKQLGQAQREYELAHSLQELEQAIAAVESDRYLTTEQKQARILPLLQKENDKLAERIRLLDQALRLETDPAKRVDLLKARDEVSVKKVGVQGQIEAARPQSVADGIRQGVSGQGGFLDSLGTSAQNAADIVKGTLNSALQGTAGLIENLWLRTQSWGDAWRGMIIGVGKQFSQMISEQIAKLLFRYTFEEGLRALGLAADAGHAAASTGIHAAGEGAKTGATLAGAAARGAIRLGETIFHGIQVAIRVAAHLAGELAQTTITVVQSGARIVAILAESAVSLVKAAIGGMSAMASIPFVGPVLAIAALAAIMGAGSKLLHRERGGPVTAGQSYIVGEKRPELFVPGSDGYIFPDLANLPSAVSAGMARPTGRGEQQQDGSAGQPSTSVQSGDGQYMAVETVRAMMRDLSDRITIVNVQDEVAAKRVARAASGDILKIIDQNRVEVRNILSGRRPWQ